MAKPRAFEKVRKLLLESGFEKERTLYKNRSKGLPVWLEILPRAGYYIMRVGTGDGFLAYRDCFHFQQRGLTQLVEPRPGAERQALEMVQTRLLRPFERLPLPEKVRRDFLRTGRIPKLYGDSRRARLLSLAIVLAHLEYPDEAEDALTQLEEHRIQGEITNARARKVFEEQARLRRGER